MSELKHPELFPIAMGSEEETMMMVGPAGASPDKFGLPLGFLGGFAGYLPKGVNYVSSGNGIHTQAGNIMYRTGATDSALFERGTPECASPAELTTAIQSSERTLVLMTGNFVRERANGDDAAPKEVRIQKRVVDGVGHTVASHDNFEVRRSNWLHRFDEKPSNGARLSMIAHMATRSLITGAGYITPNGVRFAQKVESLGRLEGYGFFNSAYRTVMSDNTGARFEVRCNDINISPWAIRMRVGGAALVLTAVQTELMAAIRGRVPAIFTDRTTNRVDAFRHFNGAHIDYDGSLKAGPFTNEAIDYQEWQFETIGKHLGKYVEIGPEYQDIIEETLQYCQDLRSVLNGDEDLKLLADRSDYAAKFMAVNRSVQRGRADGFERSVTDDISQMWDMKYDRIRVSPGLRGQPRVEYGYGYKLRDKGHFRGTVPEAKVEEGVYRAPRSTRAYIRGELIRKQKLNGAQWNALDLRPGAEGIGNRGPVRVSVPRPLLSPAEQQLTPEAFVSRHVRKVAEVAAVIFEAPER